MTYCTPELLQAIVESLPDTVALLDAQGVVLCVNRSWREYAEGNGGSATLATGTGVEYLAVLRRAAGDDPAVAQILAAIEAVLAGGQDGFQYEYPCHSGATQRWFEFNCKPLAGQAGVLMVHRDITARKLLQLELDRRTAELQQSKRDLEIVLDSVPSLIGYWDRDCRNRFANHAYRHWFGLDPKDFVGKHIREVIGEERYRLNQPYIEAVLRGEMQLFERAIPAPDGSLVRHSLARYLPDVVNGEVVGFYVEVTDVTAVKAREFELQRLQETALIGNFTLVLATGRWRGSPVINRIYGLPAVDEHGLDEWLGILHPDDRDRVEAAFDAMLRTRSIFDIDFRIVRADDRHVRWIRGFGQTECAQDGQVLRVTGTVQDITERKDVEFARQVLLEENTRLVRRLISVQEQERTALAHELHDELSQHLTAIRTCAGAIQRSRSDHWERIVAAARSVESSASAIYGVTHRMMEGLHPGVLDTVGLVGSLHTLLQTCRQQSPEVDWRGYFSGPHCRCEQARVAIYRVVQECLNNVSRHARARRVRLTLSGVRRNERVGLRLVVRDDGVGFAAGAPQGGFGLLGMRERVLGLGGQFDVSSRPGAGTRIRAWIPSD